MSGEECPEHTFTLTHGDVEGIVIEESGGEYATRITLHKTIPRGASHVYRIRARLASLDVHGGECTLEKVEDAEWRREHVIKPAGPRPVKLKVRREMCGEPKAMVAVDCGGK